MTAFAEHATRLSRHSYSTLRSIQGPLLFVDKVSDARMSEAVRIAFPDGHEAAGEVLRIEGDTVLIQVIGDHRGLDMDHTEVVFTDAIERAPLSPSVLNRTSAARSSRSTTCRCSCRSVGPRCPAIR